MSRYIAPLFVTILACCGTNALQQEAPPARNMAAEQGLKAVVIGASGAVGSNLVRELLASPRWTQVTVVARRDVPELKQLPGADTKLVQHVVDLEKLETDAVEPARGSDAAFCAMGVGQPSKVSNEELVKVDVTYSGAFARAAKAAGVKHISLLGATDTAPDGRLFYSRTKAAAEQAFVDSGIERLSFFRPSLLVTENIRYGLQDRITQALFPILSHILPARYHEIKVSDLGRAMRINAERAPLTGDCTTTNANNQTVEILQYPEYVRILEQEPVTAAAKPASEL